LDLSRSTFIVAAEGRTMHYPLLHWYLLVTPSKKGKSPIASVMLGDVGFGISVESRGLLY